MTTRGGFSGLSDSAPSLEILARVIRSETKKTFQRSRQPLEQVARRKSSEDLEIGTGGRVVACRSKTVTKATKVEWTEQVFAKEAVSALTARRTVLGRSLLTRLHSCKRSGAAIG